MKLRSDSIKGESTESANPPHRLTYLGGEVATGLRHFIATGTQQPTVVGKTKGVGHEVLRDRFGAVQFALKPTLMSNTETFGNQLVAIDRCRRLTRGKPIGRDEIGLKKWTDHSVSQ